MSEQIPDPSKRSFMHRLVQSFFDMVQEWNALTAEWNAAPRSPAMQKPSVPRPEAPLNQRIKELQRLPPDHLVLLHTFDPPRPVDDLSGVPEPFKTLAVFQSERMKEALARLQAAGALVRSDLRIQVAHRFSRDELQAMLKAQGLPVSGNKPELAERLARADEPGMWAAVGDKPLLECTPWAWLAAKLCLEHAPEAIGAEPDAADQTPATTTLHEAVKWVLAAAAGGVIGNRVDAALTTLVEQVTAELKAGNTPRLDQPQSPLPSPLTSPAEPSSPLHLRLGAPREPEMILIPAGPFWMGSDPRRDPQAQSNEQPQHQVVLDAFYIARYPVTNLQYKVFVDATGHRMPGHWREGQIPAGKNDHPVVYVTWLDAQAYCRWLSQFTGQPYRLPSEAEWEKAARGTDGCLYPWGNAAPDNSRCNFNHAINDTTAVGQYPQGASPYGCLDMAGNVWEWTASLWGKDWQRPDFGYPYVATDGREDLTAGNDVYRIFRGGAWYSEPGLVRCAFRYWHFPRRRLYDSGFRLARLLS